MTQLLTGTFVRSLDDKQRFAIPKSLRDAIGHPEISVMFMAPGTDGSLALYTEAAFSQLAEQLGSDSPTAHDIRAFSRLFYAQAQRVEIDRQGRVRVPAELAKWAELEGEIVLLGVRDHMELWNRSRWEGYLAHLQGRYDEIAESAFARRLPDEPPRRAEPTAAPPHPTQPR